MKATILPALGFALLLAAAPAQASSRSSAAYSIPADTIEAGGRRVTSAAYTIDGSLGGIGGIGTAAAPATTAKHSYIGQLYDLTNVIITASPATVNEGATRQLAATATLDDGTALTPALTDVTWSVVNGPITSVNASGLATAGPDRDVPPAGALRNPRGIAAARHRLPAPTQRLSRQRPQPRRFHRRHEKLHGARISNLTQRTDCVLANRPVPIVEERRQQRVHRLRRPCFPQRFYRMQPHQPVRMG